MCMYLFHRTYSLNVKLLYSFSFTILHFLGNCLQPKAKGNGPKSKRRYYFDVNKGKCKSFTYTGSGGNRNNFPSKELCNEKCLAAT